jgi:hypothetical protein
VLPAHGKYALVRPLAGDGDSTRLREVLGDLVGVSEEFLERIDRVSPGGYGPVFRYLKDVMLYERLVLLALAESTLARQQVDSMREGRRRPCEYNDKLGGNTMTEATPC